MKSKKTKGMGRLFLRGAKWWIQYSAKGVQHRESSGSSDRADALKLLTVRLADVQAGKPLAAQGGKLTLERLLTILLIDYRRKKLRSTKRAAIAAKHLLDYFGKAKLAADLDKVQIDAYTDQRPSEHAAAGSINRELAALKRAFTLARKAGLIAGQPVIELLPEASPRQGFIDHGEFQALLAALPGYLKDPISFLYLCAWRREEVFGLQWRDVKAETIRLRPEDSKTGKGRTLPLRGELAAIIERARTNRRLDCLYVFHRAGRPIRDFRHVWRKALAQAGLAGLDPPLLVHDLRRSAIRNLVRAGVSERVAMGLSGHQTRSVFDRYDIVDERDLSNALDRQSAYLEGQPATPRKIIPLIKGQA